MTIPEPHAVDAAQRARREAPERMGPHRSPGHAFRRMPEATSEAAEPTRRVLGSAVDTAYRVYDDYLQCARALAAQQDTTRDWRTPMGPKMLDPRAAASQWFEFWQEMMRGWMGAFAPFVPGAQGMAPFGDPGLKSPWAQPPAMQGFAAPVQGGGELELELETTQRARVSLHFLRKPSTGLLKAQLHREEGEGRLTLELDAARVQIKVADDQAPGTYSGVIRDGHGEQVGMLTVQLFGRRGM